MLNVFSIIFPAVTGIMVGSNLSGDLKEPGVAIPVGTFWAMLSSYIMYMFLIFTMAYSFSPNTLMFVGPVHVALRTLCCVLPSGLWSGYHFFPDPSSLV